MSVISHLDQNKTQKCQKSPGQKLAMGFENKKTCVSFNVYIPCRFMAFFSPAKISTKAAIYPMTSGVSMSVSWRLSRLLKVWGWTMENWVISGTCLYQIPFFNWKFGKSVNRSNVRTAKIARCIFFKINLGRLLWRFLLEGTLFPAAVELLFSYALTPCLSLPLKPFKWRMWVSKGKGLVSHIEHPSVLQPSNWLMEAWHLSS